MLSWKNTHIYSNRGQIDEKSGEQTILLIFKITISSFLRDTESLEDMTFFLVFGADLKNLYII